MTYDKYIGLPYLTNGRTEAGVDCWGLVRLFYRDELNIDLPSYTDSYNGPNDPAIASMMDEFKDVNWKKQTKPEVGDVCVFNIYGEPCHVGVYIGNSKFMHSREDRDVAVESLDNPKWSKRLEGYYKPDSSKQINVVGAPHPLKTSVHRDWTVAGTTVRDFVNFTKEKYKVSDRLSSRLRIVVDGKEIPMEEWDTTVLEQGQTIAYRSVPEGKDSMRMILMVALIVVANVYGPELGAAMGLTETTSTTVAGYTEATTAVTTTGRIVGTMAINMAGMALMNAVFPIRPMTSDATQGRSLNMFTGASNQINKFGAIPVVLGKVRMTGVLGAAPYIETMPDTSVINLLIVWGFGPLQISNDDICVGLTPLKQYYTNKPETSPQYVTLKGTANEDASQLNKLYPSKIEQKVLQIELKNNSTDGVTWSVYRLAQKAESLEVGLTFPEGMREVTNTGAINEAIAGIEIQVAKHNPSSTADIPEANWSPVSTYSVGYWSGATPVARAYVYPLVCSRSYTDSAGDNIQLYQYITFAVSPNGGIQQFEGAATDNQNADPSSTLKSMYLAGSFAGLVGTDTSSYTRLPSIPNGYIKLYTLCTYNGSVISTTDHSSSSTYTKTGLALTVDVLYYTNTDDNTTSPSGTVNIVISSGKVFAETGTVPAPGVTQTVFNSSQLTGVYSPGQYSGWCSLLKTRGVWASASINSNSMDITQTAVFPYTGYYYIEAAADDSGSLYINNNLILDIAGYSEPTSGLVYLQAGSYPVQLKATNVAGLKAAAFNITYTANSGMNALGANNSGVNLYFGSAGFFSKRKDAFNFNYRIGSLPHDYYAVRVRRTTDDTAAPTADIRRYFKAIWFDVTGYSNQDDYGNEQPPLINPPGCYLAKTAIRAQSTNKINGSIDGVNAMVQTMAPVWDKTTKSWNFGAPQATNNPASLFLYVLMHPANAYRIENVDKATSINLDMIGDWYEFCNGNNMKSMVFTYNDVVTSTKSVMEILRDICAAGMASPAFIDGKWSVIIDRPRTYTSQYFTTHNSWGFESTKLLPKIPDGFRITFPNEAKAFQQDEKIVYNYGKTKDTAKVFESISLPGITNANQVEFFAKWHLAQLKLRPEVYSLNVDFEYLVCTRGDLVKVSHDIPKWGVSSGRISSISNPTTIQLSESTYLEAGKQYSILIRTNNVNTVNTTTKALQGVTKSLAAITVSGMYDQVTLSSALVSGDNVETDNLYMLGEIGKETQQLIVVSIEPMSNTSAKLTLVDYSPEIYTADATASLVSYDTNITGENIPLIQGSIQAAPVISSIVSDTALSQQIATGTYQNNLLIGFSNPIGLTKNAEKVQIQVVSASTDFNDSSPEGTIIVNKEASSVSIPGLKTNGLYKVRARYISSSGSIVGPWSSTITVKNIGKTINYFKPSSVTVSLQGTTLVATANATITDIPEDFNTYEYRFIQGNTDSTDFWNLDITANNIKVVQSRTSGRLNITDFPKPRISNVGITYRVACRAVDNNNNYSTTSALSSVLIKTIT